MNVGQQRPESCNNCHTREKVVRLRPAQPLADALLNAVPSQGVDNASTLQKSATNVAKLSI